MTTIWGRQIAELTTSRQQQLTECDQKSQTDFDQERAQWIHERKAMRGTKVGLKLRKTR